jgi:peptidoglycan/LPS O-acetylase OafA/YrhL
MMRRIKELDSIRGLAALAIVVFHLWLRQVGSLGLAVNVFFVLSGYLITSIILNNEPTEHFLITFYIRRCLRIWPIYYLALAVLVLINPWLPTRGNLEDLTYYLTYTQEISHYWSTSEPTFPDAFRHTWSLAIEEQFYLFWPAILLLAGRRRLPVLAAILVALAVVARALDLNHFILITQCDGLALGGFLAHLLAGKDRMQAMSMASRTRLTGLCAAVSGLSIALVVLAGWVQTRRPELIAPAAIKSLMLFGINLLILAMTAAVVVNAGGLRLRWLRDRRLVYMGTISYGLYLYHQVVFSVWENFAVQYGWRGGLLTDVAKFSACVALASLSWHLLERPILALKDRFTYQVVAPVELEIPGKVNDLGGVEAG